METCGRSFTSLTTAFPSITAQTMHVFLSFKKIYENIFGFFLRKPKELSWTDCASSLSGWPGKIHLAKGRCNYFLAGKIPAVFTPSFKHTVYPSMSWLEFMAIMWFLANEASFRVVPQSTVISIFLYNLQYSQICNILSVNFNVHQCS